MEGARLGLQASLLVRSAKTGELFVNFDPEILTQIREVNCMTRMNLEIPPFGIQLQQKQNSLKKSNQKLQVNAFLTLKLRLIKHTAIVLYLIVYGVSW